MTASTPTEPFIAFFDPDEAKRQAQPIIALACPLLRELVNHGSHAFVECQAGQTGDIDEALGPLRLYYQVVEMIDGVEVQLREACVYPAMTALRSAWEANLHQAFIHAQGDRHAEAALAWLVASVKRKIKSLRDKHPAAHLPSAQVAVFSQRDLRLIEDIQKRVDRLETALRQPKLHDLAKRIGTKWYKAFGGGANLWQLSIRMDQLAEERAAAGEEDETLISRRQTYQFLSNQYSEVIHGGDFNRFVTEGEGGKAAFIGLRDPRPIVQVASTAAATILESTRLMVRKYRPDRNDQLVEWYKRNVQERYIQLSQIKVATE